MLGMVVIFIDVGGRRKFRRAGVQTSESEVFAEGIPKKPVHPILERGKLPEGIPFGPASARAPCHDYCTSCTKISIAS